MNGIDLIVFVGPTKTGTTWWYEYIKNHPQLCTSVNDKEIEFFNKYFDRGIQWYLDFFEEKNKVCCDVSPTYFSSDLVASRIKKSFPNAKIVITLRHPVKRTLSHYKHFYKLGIIPEREPAVGFSTNTSFVNSSFYTRYFPNWTKHFSSENLLILPLELMQESPEIYIEKVCKFINVEPIMVEDLVNTKINEQTVPRSKSIAFIFSRLRKLLRKSKFSFIIDLTKKAGFKKLIYSGGNKEPDIREETINELNELFRDELKELKEYVDSEIYSKYYQIRS